MQIEAIHRLPETELGTEFEPNEGLVGRVLATGKPVILDNYGDLDRITLPEHTGNAVIGMPIPGPSGGLIGVFGIGARPPRKFGQSDLATLRLFARHAAIAIQNAMRYGREQRRTERMMLIASIARVITSGLEPEELVATAAQAIHNHLGYRNVVIPLLYRGEEDYLLFRAHAGAYQDIFEQPFRMPATQGHHRRGRDHRRSADRQRRAQGSAVRRAADAGQRAHRARGADHARRRSVRLHQPRGARTRSTRTTSRASRSSRTTWPSRSRMRA